MLPEYIKTTGRNYVNTMFSRFVKSNIYFSAIFLTESPLIFNTPSRSFLFFLREQVACSSFNGEVRWIFVHSFHNFAKIRCCYSSNSLRIPCVRFKLVGTSVRNINKFFPLENIYLISNISCSLNSQVEFLIKKKKYIFTTSFSFLYIK